MGKAKRLDAKTQADWEAAAVLHDIACPLCRENYRSARGTCQQTEGKILAQAFLRETGHPDEFTQQVAFLAGHHHTLKVVRGAD